MQTSLKSLRRSFAFLICFFSAYTASANVLGNMQTLSPTPDSLNFQNVHSSNTLKEDRFNVGFFLAFVRNELSAYNNLTDQKYLHYKDYGIASDLIAAWGVTKDLEVTFAMPMFIYQKPDSDQGTLHSITRGVNTYRPGVKYNLIKYPSGGGWAIAGSIDFPISIDDPYVGSSPKPIENIEGVWDLRRGKRMYGVNVGYRHRDPGSVPASNPYFFPLHDQLIYSLAYAYGIGLPHRYHIELMGAESLNKEPHKSADHVRALEALIGYKQMLWPGGWGHIGATAEVLPQGLAPEYRVYAGVNWFFGGTSSGSRVANVQPKAVADKTGDLRVDPASAQVLEGSLQNFVIAGGQPPYKAHLNKALGEWNNDEQTYLAPTQEGYVLLIVEDSRNHTVEVPITIKSVPKAGREFVIQNLEFVFGKTRLTPASDAILSDNVAKLQSQDIETIVVAGHTDSIGSASYNQKLSRRRAQAVAEEMSRQLNLSMDHFTAVGYGEDRPIDDNSTEEGRAHNRRVELKIYYSNQPVNDE